MTETTTPTEGEEVINSGSQSDLPEDNQAENSAVENAGEPTSTDDEDNGSVDSTEQDEEEQGKPDSSLKKFAKAQGYSDEDLENLSERELKTLKLAQSQQRQVRQQMQQKPKGEIEKELNTITPDSDLDDRTYTDFRIRQRDMISDIRDYWRDNPEDVQYEQEAIALLQQEKELYGDEAMLRLAGNMPRLVREAKFAAGASNSETVAEKARREERERLRKAQEGAADSPHATTDQSPSNSTDAAEFLKNYDPTDPEQRKKADELIAQASRGKIY